MSTIQGRFNAQTQARLASIVAGLGLVWSAQVATASRLGVRALVVKPGVVELLCFSILLWLIAKLRTALRQKSTT